MKDFHGEYNCKTEKKTLPIPPNGFSMKVSRYRDCINIQDVIYKRIPNRFRNCNRIPFRSLYIGIDTNLCINYYKKFSIIYHTH